MIKVILSEVSLSIKANTLLRKKRDISIHLPTWCVDESSSTPGKLQYLRPGKRRKIKQVPLSVCDIDAAPSLIWINRFTASAGKRCTLSSNKHGAPQVRKNQKPHQKWLVHAAGLHVPGLCRRRICPKHFRKSPTTPAEFVKQPQFYRKMLNYKRDSAKR